jgi:alpha,alpha-trehalase
MAQSAASLVMNLCSMLDTYGFVPNGARSYYINRSQPPLLSAMVRDVWAATRSDELLRVTLPLLIREHAYWTTGNKAVRLLAHDGSERVLSRYYADWYQPRPESYR